MLPHSASDHVLRAAAAASHDATVPSQRLDSADVTLRPEAEVDDERRSTSTSSARSSDVFAADDVADDVTSDDGIQFTTHETAGER